MKFVQIIEFKTRRIDQFNAALDAWMAQSDSQRIPTRAIQTKDRDAEDSYCHIIEFPSYEKAMENSNRPETSAFAASLAKLCDEPPKFRNLDVTREDEL